MHIGQAPKAKSPKTTNKSRPYASLLKVQFNVTPLPLLSIFLQHGGCQPSTEIRQGQLLSGCRAYPEQKRSGVLLHTERRAALQLSKISCSHPACGMGVMDPQRNIKGLAVAEIWGKDPVHPEEEIYSKIAEGVLEVEQSCGGGGGSNGKRKAAGYGSEEDGSQAHRSVRGRVVDSGSYGHNSTTGPVLSGGQY